MWAWRACGIGAAMGALAGDRAAETHAPSTHAMTDRPLFLSDRHAPRLAAPHADIVGAPVPPPVYTAPIPPAAFTSAVLVGGIIIAGLMRRRNK